jgi:hypothetical protein
MDSRICQTFTATPAEPGGLLRGASAHSQSMSGVFSFLFLRRSHGGCVGLRLARLPACCDVTRFTVTGNRPHSEKDFEFTGTQGYQREFLAL